MEAVCKITNPLLDLGRTDELMEVIYLLEGHCMGRVGRDAGGQDLCVF